MNLHRTKPYIPEEDKDSIMSNWKDVLDTGMFIQGKYVEELESKFASMCNTKYAIATNSGATALEIALRATGIKNKKFLVPTQTFVASVSAIIRSNNIPKITDVDLDSQCLNLEIIKENVDETVAGVMLVHMAGMITPDYSEIKKFCDEKGLIIIEDAAHAVGASIDNIPAGNLGLAGCFSLFATKIITSGEGGMITTNDQEFAKRCRLLRNHGMEKNVDIFLPGIDFGVTCTYASSNYRMPELSAVLGISQIKRANEFVDKRIELANLYNKFITNKKIIKPTTSDNIRMSYWQYIIKIKDIQRTERVLICKRLLEEFKIPTANAYWPACHSQPAFKKYVKGCVYPNAKKLLSQHIALPMYCEMSKKQIKYVAETLNKII
jgi:perosamine synthetase